MQTDFRDYTTYPPQVIFLTTISTDTTWGPQVAREVGGPPDRGYHYPALDYALGAVKIGECQVTVLPGTAFGEFCVAGLELANGARLVAQGTPDRPIRFVPFPVVQEQQLNWGNAPAPYLICGPTHAGVVSPPPPSLTLRFVQFSQPAANGWGCFSQTDWYAFTAQDVRDCQFLNAWNQFWGPWAVANTIEVRNNLFQRSPASFVGCQTLSLYNNLFWGGSNYFKSHQVGF